MNDIQYKKISKFFRIQKFIFLCSLLDSTLNIKEELFSLLKNSKIKHIKIKKTFFFNFIMKTNNFENSCFLIKGDLILLGFETFSEFLNFYDKRNKLIFILKILFSFQYQNLISIKFLNLLKKKKISFYKNIYFISNINKKSIFILLYLIYKIIENKLISNILLDNTILIN